MGDNITFDNSPWYFLDGKTLDRQLIEEKFDGNLDAGFDVYRELRYMAKGHDLYVVPVYLVEYKQVDDRLKKNVKYITYGKWVQICSSNDNDVDN